MRKFISIDIGGTSIKYAVIDESLNFILTDNIPTRKTVDNNFILEDIDKIIGFLTKNHEISGIGISTAGVVDSEEGKIIYAGPTIPNYTGTEIKKIISAKYNIKTNVENDVNCAALGEVHSGCGNGFKSIFMITVGTGIGGAIIIDNELFKGFNNSAGEIGYTKINGKAVQTLASTTALVRKTSKRLGYKIDGKEIFNLAQEGNNICIEEIDNMLDIISELISSIIYTLNPEVVILGGGIMERKDYISENLDFKMKSRLPDRFYNEGSIKFAQLGNKAGMVGAICKLI